MENCENGARVPPLMYYTQTPFVDTRREHKCTERKFEFGVCASRVYYIHIVTLIKTTATTITPTATTHTHTQSHESSDVFHQNTQSACCVSNTTKRWLMTVDSENWSYSTECLCYGMRTRFITTAVRSQLYGWYVRRISFSAAPIQFMAHTYPSASYVRDDVCVAKLSLLSHTGSIEFCSVRLHQAFGALHQAAFFGKSKVFMN